MQLKDLKSITRIFLFILSFATINSCGKSPIENTIEDLVDANEDGNTDTNNEGGDDNTENEDELKPNFTANINETKFIASTLVTQSLTGAFVNIGDSGYFLGITGQYLSPDLKSTQIIILYVFGVDFDELSADTEFNVTSNILGTVVPGAFAIYGGDPNVDVDDDNFGTETLDEISVQITAIDKEKQLISGEFSFIAIDGDTNQDYRVTEGLFADLEYEKNKNFIYDFYIADANELCQRRQRHHR